MLSALAENPLVSIMINCKNGKPSIRRSIEGVLAQSYPRVELVFQDGGSTDGTIDIVLEYMESHPGRIRLNREPDSCAEEGFFRGLKACRGDIIAVSCSDEELLPHAAALAVERFGAHPGIGATYGDVYVTDLEGRITDTWTARPFSLDAFLRRECDPPFASSFFRKEAMIEAGLFERKWDWSIGEFELWLRIGMKYPIDYIPGVLAKYAWHSNSCSYKGFLDDETFVARRKAFFERFFDEPDLPESIRALKQQAFAGLHLFIAKVLSSLNEDSKAHAQLVKSLEYIPNGQQMYELMRRLPAWNIEMLRKHIASHLADLPPRRIVCYGAGNDFTRLLASGVFSDHTVVAVIDNFRPEGDLVEDVPVVREHDLAKIEHNLIVVTSSKWARELRTAATNWSMNHTRYIPVI